MPVTEAYLAKRPSRSKTPTNVNPHILTLSEILKRVGLPTMVLATPDNSHLESKRYAAEDQ